MLILLSLAAMTPGADRYAGVKDVMLATSVCLDSTSKKSAKEDVPPKFGFVQTGNEYQKPGNIARIIFDRDQDGVARTCTVAAEIDGASAKALEQIIGAIYRSQPQRQQGSVVWLFQRRGVQGVQLFSGPAEGHQTVKIIAATFSDVK